MLEKKKQNILCDTLSLTEYIKNIIISNNIFNLYN